MIKTWVEKEYLWSTLNKQINNEISDKVKTMISWTILVALPANLMISNTKELVNLLSSDDPAALGCTSAISPDRPIPWPKWKWRSATNDDAILASLSPTPQFSRI